MRISLNHPMSCGAVAMMLLAPLYANPPVAFLEQLWAGLADPAGVINTTERDGIVSGECAFFSRDGQHVVTCSKADGRNSYSAAGQALTGRTAHMRLFDIQGNLIWDVPRSRGAINPATGRPSDQAANGVDEMETVMFSRCDNYIAAAADDSKIEMWQARDLTTGQILAQPILVQSFPVAGGADSLFYSHDGDLFFAGSEPNGTVSVFRVQGDPSTWFKIHTAIHGSSESHGINSVTVTEDDKYVATAGTNQKGGLWRLDVTRNGENLITAVDMVRLATMNEATSTLREVRFLPNVGPVSTPRRELLAITAEHDWATRIYSLQELLDHNNSGTSPPPVQTLRNFNYAAQNDTAYTNNRFGNPPEPLVFSPDGRFLINTGKTRRVNNQIPIPTNPAFIRVYETARLNLNGAEPDPVYIHENGVRNTEFMDINFDGSKLSTSHHDGSVRVWGINASSQVTIAEEGFNEINPNPARWTLAGNNAPARFGIQGQVLDFGTVFTGYRGSRFLAIEKLDTNSPASAVHTLTMNQAWSAVGFRNLQVQFAIAARTGQFETNDYLIVEADTTGDGIFNHKIAEFNGSGASATNLVLKDVGTVVNTQFQDFRFDLPAGINQPIKLRVRALNNSGNEEIGFDSLRLIGEPIPPDLDTDGDGVSDFDESIHGTDPNDSGSVTRMEIGIASNGFIEATADGMHSRSYTLQRNLSLDDTWINIANVLSLPANQSILLVDDDPPENRAFYRLAIKAN